MKKLFTSILLFFVVYQSFALSIPIPQAFNGSVLCDTLSTTYFLPEDLQGRYDYTTTVIKSDTGNYLEIQYHLTSSTVADSVKQITTDLFKYFNTDPYPSLNNLFWHITHNVYINETKEHTYTKSGNSPFKQCYTVSSSCNEVKIYRKTLRQLCSTVRSYLKATSSIVSNDSILVAFQDSITFDSIVCAGIGSMVYTDSIIVKDRESIAYKVILKEGPITCPGPGICPIALYYPIGTADLSSCIISGIWENKLNETRLYPNPASLTINIPELEGEIRMTNQLGQHYIFKGNERIDISNLEKGLYLVSYDIKGKRYQEKLIVQ